MSLLNRRAKAASAAGDEPRRTIDPAAYGFVPAADVNADLPAAQPELDEVRRLVALGDWPVMAQTLSTVDARSDWRFMALRVMSEAASKDDTWLQQWLVAQPRSVDALSVLAESLTLLAWDIRTSSPAPQVAPEQWDAFFRVLRQVPQVCERAAGIDPDDPAPHVMLLPVAKGLQWENDRYRALWREVSQRAPHSFTAVDRAYSYWFPRWYGSRELLTEFVESEVAAAPPGSLLPIVKLDVLYTELRPQNATSQERNAYYRGEPMNAAIDAALDDLDACDPAHPKRYAAHHWLAYLLYLNDRAAEAHLHFQAVGGYCGARPWNTFTTPKPTFTSARATNTLEWEDAGRPPAPPRHPRPGTAGGEAVGTADVTEAVGTADVTEAVGTADVSEVAGIAE